MYGYSFSMNVLFWNYLVSGSTWNDSDYLDVIDFWFFSSELELLPYWNGLCLEKEQDKTELVDMISEMIEGSLAKVILSSVFYLLHETKKEISMGGSCCKF